MQRRSAQLAISSVLEILLDATNKNRLWIPEERRRCSL
jgi:hypothetical protein